jgi:nucleotide-binding universal stress UspA family protein
MTPTILVPLDGSLLAERALTLAGRLAESAHARVILTRVMSDEDGDDESDVRSYLHYAAGRLNYSGVPVETLVRRGDASAQILAAAHQYGAELVVMSTHGRSGPGRWLYGSVADEVLRSVGIPLVLLPPAAQPELAEGRPLRILVPLDGSALSEAVLGPARDWAERLRAELVLVQVVLWPPYTFGEGAELLVLDSDEMRVQAEQYLAQVAAQWRTDKLTIHCRALLGRPIASTIAQVAAEEHIDLIAMATHGRSGMGRLVLGSVATGTLQRADVPLLAVRPPALAAQVAA